MAACNESWKKCTGFGCIGAAFETAVTCAGSIAGSAAKSPTDKLKNECAAFVDQYSDEDLYAQPFFFEPLGLQVESLAVYTQQQPGKLPTPAEMRAWLKQACQSKNWTGQALTGWVKKKAPSAIAGAAAGAVGEGMLDDLLNYLPDEARSVAGCIFDKAGSDAYVAAAEALAGDVDKAAKRLAPYAAGCGLLEIADKLGTGIGADILKKIAGQLTAPPAPTKSKIGGAVKDVCYDHWTKGGKKKICPGEPGYVGLADISDKTIGMIAGAKDQAQKSLQLQADLFNAPPTTQAQSQQGLLALALLAGLAMVS